MAYIERKKNGSVKIIVPDGYDNAGRQIRPSMTIKADELTGLTERQKDKEIERRKVLFEKKVKSGTYLDGEKITFGDFADKWYHDYAEKRLAPGTLNPYRTRLYSKRQTEGHIDQPTSKDLGTNAGNKRLSLSRLFRISQFGAF